MRSTHGRARPMGSSTVVRSTSEIGDCRGVVDDGGAAAITCTVVVDYAVVCVSVDGDRRSH